MIVYHASKKGFINDVFNGTIADDIDHAFLPHLGRHTSPNEKLKLKSCKNLSNFLSLKSGEFQYKKINKSTESPIEPIC